LTRLRERLESFAELGPALKSAQKENASLEKELEKKLDELKERDSKLELLDARVESQKEDLADFRRQVASIASAHKTGQIKVSGLQQELSDTKVQLKKAQAALERGETRFANAEEKYKTRISELREKLSGAPKSTGRSNSKPTAKTTRKTAAKPASKTNSKTATKTTTSAKAASKPVAKKASAAATKTAAKKKAPATKRVVDDLLLINGIGPSFQKTLKKAGITSFQQIAVLNPQRIQELADKIGISPDRIRKDRWVQSAKREYSKKYGKKI